jgi:hypothetical protein
MSSAASQSAINARINNALRAEAHAFHELINSRGQLIQAAQNYMLASSELTAAYRERDESRLARI